jgi:transposase
MSLKPHAIGPVPEETARIARAAYPKGHIYLQLRDEFGTIYEDENFVNLYPRRGQPAEAPWRLALVSVMQCARGIIRPTSSRCRARSVGVEISTGIGSGRSWL